MIQHSAATPLVVEHLNEQRPRVSNFSTINWDGSARQATAASNRRELHVRTESSPSILPLSLRVVDPGEALERGEVRILTPHGPTTIPDAVPIAIAVPIGASPKDNCKQSKSMGRRLCPAAVISSTNKPILPPIASSLWSFESSPILRGALATMCALTVLLFWAVVGIAVTRSMQQHYSHN